MASHIQSAHTTAEGRNGRVFSYLGLHTVLVLGGYVTQREQLASIGIIDSILAVSAFLLAVSTVTGAIAALWTGARPSDRDAELFGLGLVAVYALVALIVIVDVTTALHAGLLIAGFGIALVYGLPLLIAFAVFAFLGMIFFQSIGPRLVGK